MTIPTDTMPDMAAPPEVMHPGSRELFRYWERIRGETSAPPRSRIDLKAIRRIVPWLAIIERDPACQSFTFRLAGTGICRLWGRELTGSEMLAGWRTFERGALARALDGVVVSHQPFVARLRAASEDGSEVGIEILALPASAAGHRHAQVLSSIMPFREPPWCGESRLVGFELSSLRVIWTEPLPGDHARELMPARRTPGFLRVIDGGLSEA